MNKTIFKGGTIKMSCRWIYEKSSINTWNTKKTKLLDTYSLLSIFNSLSSKLNLIKVECLIVQHVALTFIPDQKHSVLVYEINNIIFTSCIMY